MKPPPSSLLRLEDTPLTMRPNQTLLVACAALLAGCTATTNEMEQDVSFSANVDRAMVEIDGVRVGRTPIRVALDRTRNHEVVIGKSGYEVHRAVLRPTLHSGNYGFDESYKVSLAEKTDVAAGDAVPEEDLPEFNRAKALVDAPFGVDPAIYGTLAGDLAEARQSAERLSQMAAAAHKNLADTEERLAKAVAEAKAQSEQGAVQADARLESSEQTLRNALAEAEAAVEQSKKAQAYVAERIAFLESLQKKGEPAPKEAVESVAAAKVEAAQAEMKVATSQKAVAEATAALKAATEARTQATQGADSAKLQSMSRSAEASRRTTQEMAAQLELSARVVAARVEELSKQIADGKSGDAETTAALEAARKRNAELAVELAAAQNAEARSASEEADKALAVANEKAAALERQLAESRLATEAKERENRARVYAEYTARKGLLERRLRSGELTKETYNAELDALDKEIRGR